MNICFISGLGANERAFEKIGDLPYKRKMIHWIPNRENESLLEYCIRLIDIYNIQQDDILVGLSFGGVIAQQIADHLGISQVILISSFQTRDHLLPYLKYPLKGNLHKMLPKTKISIINTFIASVASAGTRESNPVMIDMLDKRDPELMAWSMDRIFESKDPINSRIVLHNIMGTKDRVISFWENDTTYSIQGGSHFAVFEKSDEVTDTINKIIEAYY